MQPTGGAVRLARRPDHRRARRAGHRVPGLRPLAVPVADGPPTTSTCRSVTAGSPPAERARACRRGARRGRPAATRPISTRGSCRAACSSAWRSPGPSPTGRRSCSWTSRSAPSTPRPGPISRTSCSRCGERHGSTILLVTHDIDESVYLADRVVVLSRPADARGGRDRRRPAATARPDRDEGMPRPSCELRSDVARLVKRPQPSA